MHFGGNRRHFITHSIVESEVVPNSPAVLRIDPEQRLPDSALRFAARQLHSVDQRIVGQKIPHAGVYKTSIFREAHEVVRLHSLHGKSELEGVISASQIRIVVILK